jgi:DNA-binding response OmpR family regulator
MKVLIVEDDVPIRRIIIRTLRSMFDVIDPWAAESADEAIDHLRASMLERPFDLVICDWDLRDGQIGKTVLEWIRVHASQLEPRFLFHSSNDAASRQRVPFVEKSSNLVLLRAAIKAACEPRS